MAVLVTTGSSYLRLRKCPWYPRLAVLLAMVVISIPGKAQNSDSDLQDLSLSDLANTTVTSVSKKAQRLSQVPAAVFVIGRDDIKRSGSLYLPEVLRLAPGVQVARINATQWAVTVRGFDGRWSNKLLVLIDGRTVYSPSFSGVIWSEQLVPLGDVERIEVIRGPGATMWGANAVNGVINVITRSALDTQGTSVSVTGGDLDRSNVSVRHGGMLGTDASYRVYSQFNDRQFDAVGIAHPGSWDDVRGGFRLDWRTKSDTFSIMGDAFGSSTHDTFLTPSSAYNLFPRPVDMNSTPSGQSMLFHWERKTGENSSIAVRMSYSHDSENLVSLGERTATIDTDFQHRIRLGSRNDLLWGVEAKTDEDDFTQGLTAAFYPAKFRDNTISGFIQDEIALLPDKLTLVVGSKLERDSYMQTPQPEPGVQLLWTPAEAHTFWASVARAIRAPSRADENLEAELSAVEVPYLGLATLITVGNPNFQPEKLTAYEAGYRLQKTRFSLDLSTFFNHYDQLRSIGPGLTTEYPIVVAPPPVIPLVIGNGQYGNGIGYEVNVAYDLTKSLRLLGDYSYLQLDLADIRGSIDYTTAIMEGEAPKHQGRITAYWNPYSRLSFDNSIYFVDKLPTQPVPGYISIVSHLGVQIGRGVSANFLADNLLDHRHLEFQSVLDSTVLSQVFGRTVRGGITWQF